MLLDERKLNEYTRELSLQYFGKPYESKVSYNNRLKKVAGRCFTKSGNIELEPVYIKHVDDEEVKDTILHELVHYHLDRQGYVREQHGAKFKALASKVGASRYAKNVPIKYYNHVKITCKECGRSILKYRAAPSTYRCGACGGKLINKHIKAVR